MRPRVFPAENLGLAGGTGRDSVASMRPRVFPAENLIHHLRDGFAGKRHASMRPRVFPAENLTRAKALTVPTELQ